MLIKEQQVGSFFSILGLVLKRQLKWNNSEDTEAVNVIAGYREELNSYFHGLVPQIDWREFLVFSQIIFSYRQNYKYIIIFSLQYRQNH